MVAGGTIAALALSLGGVAGTASAQTADDVSIVVANVPVALSTLANGVQQTLDDVTSAESFQQTFLDAIGSGASTQGAGSSVRGALVDLFWGISVEGPSSGSAVGFIVQTGTGAYIRGASWIVAVLDHPELIAEFLQDPTSLRCPDVPAGSRTLPCEVMSVEQAQAIASFLTEHTVPELTDTLLGCVADGLEGNVSLGCAPSEALYHLAYLAQNAYRYTPTGTNPVSPFYIMGTAHATNGAVLATLLAELVPADTQAAINDTMEQLAPVAQPLADALHTIQDALAG
jgi:hypothetical protein